MLYVDDCELRNSAFPQAASWQEEYARTLYKSSLLTKTVTVAPRGKHSAEACETYERQWREVAPELLRLLKGEEQVAFVWAKGPMESGGLPDLMPYIVGTNPWGDRYHVQAVTFTDRNAYTESWVSFEFCRESYERLMHDEWVDLEFVRQCVLFFDETAVEDTVSRWFGDLGLAWVCEHEALALAYHRHFEGCDVVGARARIEEAMEMVAGRFEIGR